MGIALAPVAVVQNIAKIRSHFSIYLAIHNPRITNQFTCCLKKHAASPIEPGGILLAIALKPGLNFIRKKRARPKLHRDWVTQNALERAKIGWLIGAQQQALADNWARCNNRHS